MSLNPPLPSQEPTAEVPVATLVQAATGYRRRRSTLRWMRARTTSRPTRRARSRRRQAASRRRGLPSRRAAQASSRRRRAGRGPGRQRDVLRRLLARTAVRVDARHAVGRRGRLPAVLGYVLGDHRPVRGGLGRAEIVRRRRDQGDDRRARRPVLAVPDLGRVPVSLQGIAGQFEGIGATIRHGRPGRGHRLLHHALGRVRLAVVAPLTGSPAQKAGLQPGDVIDEIDGATLAGLSV